MGAYTVAETKAHLSEILNRVEAGERVTVTRRGTPIAVISPMAASEIVGTIDWDALAAFRRTMPKSGTPASRLVREMRDEDD